ncbi:porin family protein [Pontibacter rugosus]|uniref:Porin family protein n=1 Tax=Pontibacter rugosus TaxID=1745966 RepID=A0ABW3SLA8_9BACT
MQNNFTASFLLVLALLLTCTAKAQQGRPAYFVTLANDTIHGSIKKHKAITNTIYFKATGKSSYTAYNTSQVKSFTLENNLLFEPVTITLNEQQQQVFMRVLVDGPVKLYYNENISATSQYFIQKPGEPLVHLRKNSLDGTLNYLLQDCSETVKHSAYKYTTTALAANIDAYNKCIYPAEASNKLLAHARLEYQAGMRAGTRIGSFSYTGRHIESNIPHTQNQRKADFVAAGFVNVSTTTTNFALQAELLFKRFSGSQHITGISSNLFDYTFDSKIDFTFLQLPLLLRYDVTTNSNWRPYLVAGSSYSYVLNSSFDNSITYQDKYVTYSYASDDQLTGKLNGYAAGIGVEYLTLKKASFVFDARYDTNTLRGRGVFDEKGKGRKFYISSLLFTLGAAF